jgi:hypothetical protein
MRAYVMPFLLAGSVAFLVVAPPTRASRDGTPYSTSAADGVGVSAEAEVARVRAHFDSVLAELDRRDLSALTNGQRETRASLVTTLREYRDRGAFPKNYDFPGRLVPYFVDRRTGVRCAMAHLLESTGRADIVDRVRAANNNVFIMELAADTALMAWLDASGLTIHEAARIQPTYGGADVKESNQAYRYASAFAISASVVSTFWNLGENRNGGDPVAATIGLIVGGATVGLAVMSQSFPEPSNKLALANGIAGASSILVSAGGLIRRGGARATHGATATKAASRSGVQASVAPAVSLTGHRSAGLTVNVRF